MNSTGADAVGKTVGGYRIIKEIGKGKFSFVYRAENEQRVPYAIKKIKVTGGGYRSSTSRTRSSGRNASRKWSS